MHGTAITLGQETVWEHMMYLSPHDPGMSRMNVINTVRIYGEIDPELFVKAVQDVIRRHETLRIGFISIGYNPTVEVLEGVVPPVSYVDCSGLSRQAQEERLSQIYDAERGRGFPKCLPPLWHMCLVKLSSVTHILVMCFFHMIADGASLVNFRNDVAAAYRIRAAGEKPDEAVITRYSGLLELHRRTLGPAEEKTRFWGQKLIPLADGILFPRAAVSPVARVNAFYPFAFGDDIGGELKVLAARLRTTLFVVLLTAYVVLLHLRTARRRLVIGLPTSGREVRGTARMIGQFTNNIYIEVNLQPRSLFEHAVHQVHESLLSARRHSISFQHLARAVFPDFDNRRPWTFVHLYDAWFQAAPPDVAAWTPGATRTIPEFELYSAKRKEPPSSKEQGKEWDTVRVRSMAPGMYVYDDGRRGLVTFNPTLFDHDMVRRLILDYKDIIRNILRDPNLEVADLA